MEDELSQHFLLHHIEQQQKKNGKRPRKIDGMITFCVSFHFPHLPFVSNQIAVCCWCCCVVCVRADSCCGLKRKIFCIHFFFTTLALPFVIHFHFYSPQLLSFFMPLHFNPPIHFSFWQFPFTHCLLGGYILCASVFVDCWSWSLSSQLTRLWIEISSIVRQYLGEKTHSFIRFNVNTYISRWIKLITLTSEDYVRIWSFFHGAERKEEKRKGWEVIFNDCHEWRRQRRPSMTMARERKNERKELKVEIEVWTFFIFYSLVVLVLRLFEKDLCCFNLRVTQNWVEKAILCTERMKLNGKMERLRRQVRAEKKVNLKIRLGNQHKIRIQVLINVC